MGQRWVNHDVGEENLDLNLLMWDMHRRIHTDRLPQRRVVAQFDFYGARRGTFWLVLERPEPSVCWHPPGFDTDLFVTADTLTMHRVWIGRVTLGDALRQGLVVIEGPSDLVQGFPEWLALSVFADIPTAARPS